MPLIVKFNGDSYGATFQKCVPPPMLARILWVLTDDLNQILSADEHYSIVPYDLPLKGMEELRSFLEFNNLSDVSSKGTFYTWSNERLEHPILRKLDRVLVNQSWLSKSPESVAIFDPLGDSNHSSALISLSPEATSGRKGFKYLSFVSTHVYFFPFLRETWSNQNMVGSQMFMFGQNMGRPKECCRRVNREGFSNIQQRTKDALTELENIQRSMLTQPDESLIRAEHEARESWSFFASAQENFFKLKSRIRWLSEGDANTWFSIKLS
ncbi:uncharacterized protein LOC111202995 [Brassica napus]|uniref:uncharacterized protein LOC106323273 n=1 Tax=Brassica oleracea var. oleracea TaxID=109376 RepID=UPI0006A744EA|nr:PREDICTED: uncharacterized protein LOC106323273 [Brassica oleracea var. oleracea]XP_022552080.1 uncharacterized protein LOC111202995 [Brassica napus]